MYFYSQLDAMDCGPTCLRMVAKYYGRNLPAQYLRELTQVGRNGVNLLGIAKAAEKIGFSTLSAKIEFTTLKTSTPLPCIIHWNHNHFVVVYGFTSEKVLVADPALGLVEYSFEDFNKYWATTRTKGEPTGIVLLLEPTQAFLEGKEIFVEVKQGKNLWGLYSFFFKYKALVSQLFLGLLLGSLIQLILPFLTQSLIDTGVQTQNLNFVYLILAAQLMLFFGRVSIEFIRNWILLHISARINLSILSDFLSKLLRLPQSYFESKQTGDILQRISDHSRIEAFLTGTSLTVIFSLFNLVIFSVVLGFYSIKILLIFLFSSVLYAFWVLLFLKRRREIDNNKFLLNARSQSSLIELVQSIAELRMNNATMRMRWKWENLQVQEFYLNIRSLSLQQYQQIGALAINEGKNIIISFLAAYSVINGQMTLGAMLAVQYILGQLNSPVEQLVGFIQRQQDALISLERLNEVHNMQDEEPANKTFINSLPEGDKSISLQNLTYTYPGAGNEAVLKNVTLHIPQGKITAIVGSSGSGKTTLLKLLLKFILPQEGNIKVGDTSFADIGYDFWRSTCGTVMQDGFIFSDTIANNISLSEESANIENMIEAAKVANIADYITSLPLKYNTKIGAEGNGVSQGQQQRLLIARAVYKRPQYLFFDEATNALDSENEKVIMDNLYSFFANRTVVIVAHRLSTVKHADQIVVLEKGKVVEIGTHEQLCQNNGRYLQLVKNQLELGA